MEPQKNKIVLFQSRRIRRVWHEKEWWFSVIDVVEVLTDSNRPSVYWTAMKNRVKSTDGIQLSTICKQLKVLAPNNKEYLSDCANTKSLLRIIQSIPSPKAEPFKMWLAQVGQERLEEIENPELAQERMKKLYEKKGYPKDWIEKRLRGIAIRQGLTDEWKERGIKADRDYAILTAEISKATFGMTPSQYKKYKNIPSKTKLNLRDNMTDLELIFTMLGERVTTEISQKEKPKIMLQHKNIARRGGKVAGDARKATEHEINSSVLSKQNFLGNGVKY